MWHFSCLALDPSLDECKVVPILLPLEFPSPGLHGLSPQAVLCVGSQHGCGVFKFHTINSFLVGWCTARPILCINYGVSKLSAASSGFGGHAEAEGRVAALTSAPA